jgi:hypothetical protein
MSYSDENHDRSRRPGAKNWGWSYRSVLSGRAIEKSDDAVCGLHRTRGDEERVFLD